ESVIESHVAISNSIGNSINAEVLSEKLINSKHQIITEIISKKIKKINFPDDFKGLLQEIELNSTDLLMMSIELYEKIVILVGEYQVPLLEMPRQLSTGKFIKTFYVRPKFDIGDVIKSVGSIMPNIASTLDNHLITINPPNYPMKMTDITLEEYDESFNVISFNKDMIGISKKILRDIPIYLRLRFINIFNKILENPMLIGSSSIARGIYAYKA